MARIGRNGFDWVDWVLGVHDEQATCRILHLYSSSCTRFKPPGHVAVCLPRILRLSLSLTGRDFARSNIGISFKTQALYVAVFVTRYLDILWGEWVSLYNFLMKIFFIGSSCYILYLMKFKYRCVHATRLHVIVP